VAAVKTISSNPRILIGFGTAYVFPGNTAIIGQATTVDSRLGGTTQL